MGPGLRQDDAENRPRAMKRQVIEQIIELGRQGGFVTFDQINGLLPPDTGPEDIQALFEALSEAEISVTEG